MTVREGNGLRADFVKKVGQINASLVNGAQSGYDPGADPKLGAEICRLKKKESGSGTKIEPSNIYDADAKPKGTETKITNKMDDETKRSLKRENEAARIIAQNGYNIEQNPDVEGTNRNPDYKIEGEIFDCYSPAEKTKIRNVAGTIEEKVIKKGQADRVVLNVNDWKGDVDELIKQLNDYPIEGLKEVIVVHNGNVISIYP